MRFLTSAFIIIFLSNTAFSQLIYGTQRGFPENISDKNSVVLFLTLKNAYPIFKDDALKHLDHIGVNFKYYDYWDESPIRRDEQTARINQEVQENIDYLICFEMAELAQTQIYILSFVEIIDNDLQKTGTIQQFSATSEEGLYEKLYKAAGLKMPKEPIAEIYPKLGDHMVELSPLKLYPYDVIEKSIVGLPEDIWQSKIALFTYDQIPIKSYTSRIIQNSLKAKNEAAESSNPKSIEAAKDLPLKYEFRSRLDYNKLKSEGFKYALDNDLMIRTNFGQNISAGHNYKYFSYMYLIDLETMDRYVMKDLEITNNYAYPMGINLLKKLLEKQSKK